MNHSLKELCGLPVSTVHEEDDYLQIIFGSGDCVTVYNRFVLSNLDTPSVLPISLIRVDEAKDEIVLELSNGVSVKIDLTLKGYRGPEALQWNRTNGDVVIW